MLMLHYFFVVVCKSGMVGYFLLGKVSPLLSICHSFVTGFVDDVEKFYSTV